MNASVFAAAALLVLAGAAPTPSPSPQPPGPAPSTGPAASAVVDRPLREPALTESSGLAISPAHHDILWTHNDSGHDPVLYALDRRGRSVATLRLRGVPGRDWEAVAAWRERSGRALLAVADIGDNGASRDHVEIDVVAEPSRLAAARVAPLARIRLRYPDHPADAETLLVDPRTGRMYLATKGLLSSRIYAVPESAWPGTASGPAPSAGAGPVATLELVGSVGVQLATDGAVLPDGHVLLRSYGAVHLLAPLDGGVHVLGLEPLPDQLQGEGLAATPEQLYLGSEAASSPILRMPMPASFSALLAGPGAASGTPTQTVAAARTDSAATDSSASSMRPPAGVLGLLGAAAVGGLGALVVSRAARRRGRRTG